MKQTHFLTYLLLISLYIPSLGFSKSSEGEKIIQKVDSIRNPSESFLMEIEIENPNSAEGPWSGEVKIKGNDKTLVITNAPPSQKGQNMLMLNKDMWIYMPSLKRAIRVSLSQKLMGEAANGDISRMRWYGDYNVKIEKQTNKEWTLFLTAKSKGLTYEKIRVIVDKSNYHPLSADFLSLNGKKLKTAVYRKYERIAGRIRPTEIYITDAFKKSNYSIIKIKSMSVKDFPASLFKQTSLR